MRLATLLFTIVGVAFATPVLKDNTPSKAGLTPRQSTFGMTIYCCDTHGVPASYSCELTGSETSCVSCPEGTVCYLSLHTTISPM